MRNNKRTNFLADENDIRHLLKFYSGSTTTNCILDEIIIIKFEKKSESVIVDFCIFYSLKIKGREKSDGGEPFVLIKEYNGAEMSRRVTRFSENSFSFLLKKGKK